MILVDTSVLIDFFKGNDRATTDRLRQIIRQSIPFGITAVIYQEVLQGAATVAEYKVLDEYLGSQRFFHPQHPVESYAEAAKLFFISLVGGFSPRSAWPVVKTTVF